VNAYRSYLDLPALAGIASFERASHPGLSVDECVSRLKRYHYSLKRLHGIFLARLTAEPIYEIKMGFSLHGYYCAEHVTALRRRVGEMREPPLGLEAVPNGDLELFFNEILNAPTRGELLLGIYEKALPALKSAMSRHLADTNPLADQPSVRVCRFALIELNDMIDYGQQCLSKLITDDERARCGDWLKLLDGLLSAAGGLDGRMPATACGLPRRYSIKEFQYDGKPRRDERFTDPYNMGVNAEQFLYDESMPARAKTLMMYYKRLREIDVPEMMAGIITETPGKPWAYYQDMTRQLWDEARHAMMGEVGFVNLNVNWAQDVKINFTWSLALNAQCNPLERHAVLYFIEQGLMSKTGKRHEWEVARRAGDPLAASFQDYDWADEVLHARVGRDWYLTQIGDPKKALDYGDACWSRVHDNWHAWRDQGLTQHANWWPDAYRAACQTWKIEPDPHALGFSVSYESVRADLRELPSSATGTEKS
jgi:hypothetical protein